MRWFIVASIDGSMPISRHIRADSEDEARNRAPEVIARDARSRGHDHVREDWVEIEDIEEIE